MAEIIGIRFKREGKQYYFDPQGIQVSPGQGVILETSWGVEFGECVRGNSQVPDEELVAPLRPIVRLATEEDYETVRRNHEREREALQLCHKKIQEHALDMKLVDVEYSFEGNKILFFFTSEGRVDFRALVKDLAAAFHTRIELRQIGVRDEAKMLGGLGICGRPFCCSSFLREFQPVSIKMAKTQSLSLNPTKISGTCGRLMCCLKYEQHAYEDLLKNSPRSDSFVETPDGVGDIISVNTLREKVRVRLDNAPDTLKIYHNSEIRVVRSGKGRRPEGYLPPGPQELAKLRRVDESAKAAEETDLGDALRCYMAEPSPEREAKQEAWGEERRTRGRGRNRPPNQGGKREPRKPDQREARPGEAEGPQKKQEGGPQERHPKGERPQQRRGGKPPAQAAMEKALPREKHPEKTSQKPGDGAPGEKKQPRPPWRRYPPRRGGGKKPDGGAPHT